MDRPTSATGRSRIGNQPSGLTVDLDAARHFPLVARARPACASLDDRIAEITELTVTAGTDATLHAVAHNKAALIASDCGHQDLAATLCHAHHDRYRSLPTWTAHDARLALEPLVNLARLHIRHGNTAAAVDHLHTLWAVVDTGDEHLVDGRSVTLNGVRHGSDDHRSLRTWLWTVVLAEGLRAYTTAGRWTDALAHAERHHGVGQRLLDGRQVAILAHAVRGAHDHALGLLDTSVLSDPWEPAVAACLRALLTATQPPRPLLDRYTAIDLGDGHRMFTVRLGLAMVDLLGAAVTRPAPISGIIRRILREAGADAYIARDVLRHRIACELTAVERRALTATMTRAGLADPPSVGDLETRLQLALTETGSIV